MVAPLRPYLLLSLAYWLILSYRGAYIFGVGTYDSVILQLLQNVGGPPADAAACEKAGHHVGAEAEGVEQGCGVELYVRVYLALGEIGVAVRNVIYLVGDLVPFRVAAPARDDPGVLVELGGAGVVCLVDAVAHAHQAALGGESVIDERLHVVDLTDLYHHFHCLLVGPAVGRALER